MFSVATISVTTTDEGGAVIVKGLLLEVPPAFVTLMLTAPVIPEGTATVIDVGVLLLGATSLVVLPTKCTVAPPRLVPLIVMTVDAVPDDALRLVIKGVT